MSASRAWASALSLNRSRRAPPAAAARSIATTPTMAARTRTRARRRSVPRCREGLRMAHCSAARASPPFETAKCPSGKSFDYRLAGLRSMRTSPGSALRGFSPPCSSTRAASRRPTATGTPSIHTVLRPSLRFTNPVTWGARVGSWFAAATGDSPRRRRSSRSRSSGVVKSVPSSAAEAIAQARHAAAARQALGGTVRMLVLERDPLQRALGLDARLQRIGVGHVHAAHGAFVHGIEPARAALERVEEAQHVALVQGARLELHAAREHVHRLEHAPAGKRERALRGDLVVEDELVAHPQGVQQLDHVEAAFGLQHAPVDERAEDVRGLLEVVALAAGRFHAGARLAQAPGVVGAVALLLLAVPMASGHDADGREDRERERGPGKAHLAEPGGAEDLPHEADGLLSRITRSTKRASIDVD